MVERKKTKGQTTIYKTYTQNQRPSNTNPTKNQGELGCFGRVGTVPTPLVTELSTIYLARYLEAIRHNLLTILYRKVLLHGFNLAFVFYVYFGIGNIY
jgi:hypothetical protein